MGLFDFFKKKEAGRKCSFCGKALLPSDPGHIAFNRLQCLDCYNECVAKECLICHNERYLKNDNKYCYNCLQENLFNLFQIDVNDHGCQFSHIAILEPTLEAFVINCHFYHNYVIQIDSLKPISYEEIRKTARCLSNKFEHTFQREKLLKCYNIDEENCMEIVNSLRDGYSRYPCLKCKDTEHNFDKYHYCVKCGAKKPCKADCK